MVVPLPVSIFRNEILSLCSEIVGLSKFYVKFLSHRRSNFMTNYIRELRGKNVQNQHFLSFFIKMTIRVFCQRNLVRQ